MLKLRIISTVCAAVLIPAFCGILPELLRFQFIPSLIAFSAVFLLFVLLTFLFGRFYCAFICPLGILQDFIAFISRRKSSPQKNHAKLRYAIAGIVFGLLMGGWAGGLLFLDPYSNSGRIFYFSSAAGITAFIVIAFLAVWKKRIFCTAICPAGTVMGLLAKYGVFRLKIADTCVKCGQCVRNCPAGCIDIAQGAVDNERCVRCMNCLAVCPRHSISFAKNHPAPVNESRRKFLINGTVLIAGLAAGVSIAKAGLGKLEYLGQKFGILPPGAGSRERFASKCTGCQLCVKACPSKIIVPANGGIGPVSLDLSRGFCSYDCHKCSQVCPTGAIKSLTLPEKQKLKIAEAKFDPKKCYVFQAGEECGLCAEVCPTHAATLRKSGAPYPVKTNLCIGCGACQKVCPAQAMTVHEIDKQISLGDNVK